MEILKSSGLIEDWEVKIGVLVGAVTAAGVMLNEIWDRPEVSVPEKMAMSLLVIVPGILPMAIAGFVGGFVSTVSVEGIRNLRDKIGK
ncbi:hypothetical protein A2701_03645 [Candidatus Amesbacteria bacterium RIFCSPHIGHO2_01_FULL_47_34]|uniref:Uncharacterized protein n=3 Tax=Candidatus Amesiibacteriota TaxID=1752730 RepID=A0A1F4ZTI9_9BACT|nr:MAG: hypothetical protein UX86_C0019G0005 [Candidatus Amesbacteria bacterium GW2011_GWC1_47_15]OGC98212.1 MAG: hypothetical protein A2701_03645 [Candidatus Amesbacteria bacterium RIFCSPHIGHO2_01_FULL_47_34]OGD00204.1 MAG: hypothetical protein A2972_04910 [Candidatus Amesbacteria bacterium RIFCSPLOWO2_01_FULL_47_33]OGD09705.1 MAG: hypothetical protein A2395_02270 [Candidatus Amesbacteria bacterium RIFOXYB1_FULL_47_9]